MRACCSTPSTSTSTTSVRATPRTPRPVPKPDKAADKPAATVEKVEVPMSANPTAEEMRERVLRKYTSGLR